MMSAAGIRLNPIPTPKPMIRHPTNTKLPKPALSDFCFSSAIISPTVQYSLASYFIHVITLFIGCQLSGDISFLYHSHKVVEHYRIEEVQEVTIISNSMWCLKMKIIYPIGLY